MKCFWIWRFDAVAVWPESDPKVTPDELHARNGGGVRLMWTSFSQRFQLNNIDISPSIGSPETDNAYLRSEVYV